MRFFPLVHRVSRVALCCGLLIVLSFAADPPAAAHAGGEIPYMGTFLSGPRFSATRSYTHEISEEDATLVAATAARFDALRSVVRSLITLPEVRIAGTLAPNRVEGPNLLALAHATARTFILLHSKSRKSATVTVTIVLVDEGGEPTMEARVRDALLHPDRLALYEKTALREKGILDTLDTLMPRPGGVSPLSGKSSAETIKALINELRALAIFTHLLPSRNGLWKDPAAVRDAMQEALLFAPGSSLCRNALGDAWLQLGRSQEAMEEQSLAIKADPAFARAYHSRGAAAMALGLLSSAVADFSEAIRLSPNTASSYRARGMARHLLGETAPMCADLRHACTLGECAEFEWAVANNYCTIKR